MKTIFLCGPHCAGKTTILQRLKKDGVVNYTGAEIGKEFYYQRKKQGFMTHVANELFEEEVMIAEIKRDRAISGRHYTNAVLETWHPGNLAYAAVRNPGCVKKLCNQILNSSPLIQKSDIIGINIKVSRENIFRRTRTFASSPAWAADFYSQICDVLPSCIEDLNLQKNTYTINGNCSIEDTYTEIIRIIKNYDV